MFRSFISFALLLVLVGCMGEGASKPLPPTQQVKGTVTLDGEPLQNAMVMFIPSGSTEGIECSGVTDTSGLYIPQQVRGSEGVPAGTYKVVISRFTRGGQPVGPDDAGADAGGALMESLPPKYSSPSATTLTANVPEGGGTIDFELQSN